MRDEYDPATDWTLDVYDPWDREAPPAPRRRGRGRIWLATGAGLGALLALALIGPSGTPPPATAQAGSDPVQLERIAVAPNPNSAPVGP